jgi:hypothetical protein
MGVYFAERIPTTGTFRLLVRRLEVLAHGPSCCG